MDKRNSGILSFQEDLTGTHSRCAPSCLLGWRIGKGEGYADLEYAMMVSMGAVHEGTPVVTIVHDCQVRPADLSLASLPATLGVGARDTCSSSCLPLESMRGSCWAGPAVT